MLLSGIEVFFRDGNAGNGFDVEETILCTKDKIKLDHLLIILMIKMTTFYFW